MARRAATDLSLSLVDVVTNGLASVLVLFFLLTMLRTHVTWKSTLTESRGDSTQAVDPLLIVVSAPAGANLFPTAESPWPKDLAGTGIAISHGRNYATFFTGDAPQPPQQVVLALPSGHADCEVQVIHGRQRARRTLAADATGEIVLWPLPASETPESSSGTDEETP